MSETTQLRIGDAERNQAVEALQTHHQAGRLDLSEFEDRMGTALSAKVAGDLYPLFTDLPEPRFAPPVAPSSPFAEFTDFSSWGRPAQAMHFTMVPRPAAPIAPRRHRPVFTWVAAAIVLLIVLNVMHPALFAILPVLAVWLLVRTDRRIQHRSQLANQQNPKPLDLHGYHPGNGVR